MLGFCVLVLLLDFNFLCVYLLELFCIVLFCCERLDFGTPCIISLDSNMFVCVCVCACVRACVRVCLES